MPRDLRLTRYDAPEDLRLTRFAPSPVDARRTVVGLITSGAELEARVKQLDSDIATLDVAVDKDLADMKAAQKAGQTLTDQQKARLAWVPGWTNYKFDWNAFKAKGISGWDETTLLTFEKRYRQLYDAWTAIPGAPAPPAPPSPMPEPKKPLDIPWGGILAVGGAIAVAWGLSSVVRLAKE